jgi:hypothetical protein
MGYRLCLFVKTFPGRYNVKIGRSAIVWVRLTAAGKEMIVIMGKFVIEHGDLISGEMGAFGTSLAMP